MKKAFVITLSVLALMIIGLYVAGIIIGKDHFLAHTYVNGTEVSYMKAEEAEEIMKPTAKEIVVHGLKTDEVIQPEDFGYTFSLTKNMETLIKEQSSLAWVNSLFSRMNINDPVVSSYDEQALRTAVNNLKMLDPSTFVEPKDAFIGKDQAGQYFIFPEDNGNMPYPDKVYAQIKAAIDEGKTEIFIDTDEAYQKANVTSDDPELVETMKKIESMHGEEITVDLVDATEVLDPLTLLDMTYRDEAGNIFADDDILMEFVRGLTDKYDTFKEAQPFVTHDGRKIYVGGNEEDGIGYAQDTYGFYLDEAATFYDLKNAIESGESQTVEATWEIPALARTDYNGCIGDSYIEISLDDQHLWAFWEGELILDTDLVTGLYADPEKRSPTGLFRIWDRSSPATLSGEMGGESWNSHVDFWMGITWTGVGLHNAPWRGGYGGDIYLYNGSHGCINMDYDAAETLYNTYGFDYPVVIYE